MYIILNVSHGIMFSTVQCSTTFISTPMWSERPFATHPPAFDSEIAELFKILRKISPSIVEEDKLQIDSSNIRKHPKIEKIIVNHTRGSAFFRQFYKRPLVSDCGCVACMSQMFAPMIMPLAAYEELHIRTLPCRCPFPSQQALLEYPTSIT